MPRYLINVQTTAVVNADSEDDVYEVPSNEYEIEDVDLLILGEVE